MFGRIQQAHFYVDDFGGPVNDVVNIQMALGWRGVGPPTPALEAPTLTPEDSGRSYLPF